MEFESDALNNNPAYAPLIDDLPGGLDKQRAWEGQQNDKNFIDVAKDEIGSTVVDPLTDLPMNLASVAASAVGMDDTADSIQATMYDRDLNKFGPSALHKGGVNLKNRDNLLREFGKYMVPTFAAKLVSKALSAPAKALAAAEKSKSNKALVDEIAGVRAEGKGVVTPAYTVGKVNNIKAEHGAEAVAKAITGAKFEKMPGFGNSIKRWLVESAKIDASGTLAISKLYTIGEDGEAKLVENPKSQLLAEFSANVGGSLLLGGAFALKSASAAGKIGAELNAEFQKINTAERVQVNLNEKTLQKISDNYKDTGADFTIKKADIDANSLRQLYDGKKYGVYAIDDGSVVLVSPNIGAIQLTRSNDGTFVMMKSDANLIVPQALKMESKSGIKLFDPNPAVKINTAGKMGFNSLKTSVTETMSHEMGGTGKSSYKNSGDIVPEVKSAMTEHAKTVPETVKPVAGVKKKISTLRDISNSVWHEGFDVNSKAVRAMLKDKFIGPAINKAIKTKEQIDLSVRNISDYFRSRVRSDFNNSFHKFLEKNMHSDITKSLSREITKRSIEVNQGVTDMLNKAYDSSLTKMQTKIKETDNGVKYIASEDVPDLTAATINEFFDNLGIRKEDHTLDEFKAALIESMSGEHGSLNKEKLFTGKMSLPKEGGIPVKGYILHDGKKITALGKKIFGDMDSNGIARSIEDAKTVVDVHINDLNRATSTYKNSIEFGYDRTKIQSNIKGKSKAQLNKDLNNYLSRLDNDSVPLDIVIKDGKIVTTLDMQTYQGMTNTRYYYRGDAKEITEFLNRVTRMNDLHAARYLDKIDEEIFLEARTNGASLREVVKNTYMYEDILGDIRELKAEAAAHLEAHEMYVNNKSNAMTYGVTKVSTGRFQYTGAINPQQGRLSKTLLTSTGKKQLTAKQAEGYKADAVRHSLDEYSYLLDYATTDMLKAAEIDPTSFKTKFWDVENNVIVDFGEALAPLIKNNIDTSAMTANELIAYKSITEGIGNNDVLKLVAEFDATTQMRALSDGLNKVDNPETGVGTALKDTGSDSYLKYANELTTMDVFPFLTLSQKELRNAVKDSMISGGYGSGPKGIAISFISNFMKDRLTKTYGAGKTATRAATELDSVKTYIDDTLNFDHTEFVGLIEELQNKINKSDLTDAAKDKYTREIKTILTNSTKSANPRLAHAKAAKSIYAQDRLESLALIYQSDILKRMDILDDIAVSKDTLKVYALARKIEAGDTHLITPDEIDAASLMLASKKEIAIGKAIKKAFGDDFVKLQEKSRQVFTNGYHETRLKLESTKMTHNLKQTIYKDLRVSKAEQKFIDTRIDLNGVKTLWGFIETLHLNGKDTMTSPTVYNILPKFYGPFGQGVAYVTTKASGFHEPSRMQYTGLTPISNPLPFILHSTDSGLISHASEGQAINHRWDALFDLQGFEQAKNVNNAMSYLYAKSNIYQNMVDATLASRRTDTALAANLGADVTDAIFRDTARRIIVERGEIPTADSIDFLKDTLKKEFGSNGELAEINKISTEIELRNEGIARTDSPITMQNMTNGNKGAYTSTKPSQLLDTKYTREHSQVQYGRSSFDVNNLKSVKVPEAYTVDPMSPIKFHSTTYDTAAVDVEMVQKGLKSSINDIGNRITLGKAAKDSGFWIELAHEVVHAVGLNIYGHETVAKDFLEFYTALKSKDIRIGTREGGKVMEFEKAQLEAGADLGPISPADIYGNELSASVLDRLIANELIYANKELVSTTQGKTNLSGEVTPLVMIDSVGKEFDLYTISDLQKFMDAQGISGKNALVDEFGRYSLGLINGSTKIRDFIFEKKMPKFESTLNYINGDIKGINFAAHKANDVIMNNSFLEIFQMNPEGEALQTALSLSKGVEKKIRMVVAKVLDRWDAQLTESFGTEAAKSGRTLGTAWTMGLNKLFFEHVKSNKFDMLNLTAKDLMDANGKTLLDETLLQQKVADILHDFGKTITGHAKDPGAMQLVEKIHKKVKALADGHSDASLQGVTDLIETVAKRYMNKNDIQYFRGDIVAQKLASLYIISKSGKHHAEFKKVHDFIGRHGTEFENYMQQANVHSNPESLFGENVEMLFLEDGKSAYFTEASNTNDYLPADRIGTAHKDGVDYIMVSVDGANKRLGDQNTDLIRSNLSNFEIGKFEKDGIVFNGQRAISDGGAVDKSIVKQLSRNLYVKKHGDVAKDLGYRQWHMLRDQNILMTHGEMQTIKEMAGNSREFGKLSEKNPITKSLGVQYYFDKRYLHYLEGTKGVDVRAIANQANMGPEMTKFIEGTIFGAAKLTGVLKNFILVSRMQSYFNSFVGSMTTYATHAKNVQPTKDAKTAKAETAKFKRLLNDYVKLETNKDPAKQAAAQKFWDERVSQTSMYKLIDAGLINTMRADLYNITSLDDLGSYQAIKKATGSKEYANFLKTFTLHEDTKAGAIAGEFFDMMETRPKLMLYYNLVKTMGHDKAVQKVVNAFPTYNNLPYGLNIFNSFSPYTKFFYSTPRMISYGLDQNKYRMGLGVGLAHSIVPVSYMASSDQEKEAWKWHRDAGFIKVPFADYSYASNSLWPIWNNPFHSPYGTTIGDVTFPYTVLKSSFDKKSYIAGTSLPEVK